MTKNNNNGNLKFGTGNAKLATNIATFSLPAGHSCPFAKECLSKADKITGKIIDGKHCKFRCFAASQECVYPTVRRARWFNFELLKNEGTVAGMGKWIQRSLPYGFNIVRTHVSGDFFGEKYFLAWLNVALNNPLVTFYGYTKALPFLVEYKKYLPSNFRFTASKGGTCDSLIARHKLKSAEVVFSVKEAKDKGLEIDHDDSHAITDGGSFALLLHGSQPAGSAASKAWEVIKKEVGGYGENTKRKQMVLDREHITYISVKNGQKFFPNKLKSNNTPFKLVSK